MKQFVFKRYIWLIDTIYHADKEGITYEKINEKWKENSLSRGKNYPIRTFHNHRKEIHDVFNISILCKKNTNTYYIEERGTDHVLKKLLELITINQLFTKNEKLKDKCIIDDHTGGTSYLSSILSAINQQKIIRLEYHPYWENKTMTYQSFAPYALKEFKNQWFVLGQRDNAPLEIIDIKQVTNISILEHTYTIPSDINVTTILNENYGTTIENISTEEITIKISPKYARYLRNVPLHNSQKEIEKKKNYSIFYYYLKPTKDFIRDILFFCSDMEILAPQTLRTQLAQEAKKIARKNS